jgi:hypothetical protein
MEENKDYERPDRMGMIMDFVQHCTVFYTVFDSEYSQRPPGRCSQEERYDKMEHTEKFSRRIYPQ